MTTPSTEDIAALIGAKVSEIKSVEDTDAGLVIETTDGTQQIVVPDDKPDAEGKTGLMFLVRPTPRYQGTFPVFEPPVGTEAPVKPDLEPGEYPIGGTGADVLRWIAGDLDRAKEAITNETSQKKPRSRLLGELEAIVAQWNQRASDTADEALKDEEALENADTSDEGDNAQ